MSETLDDIEVGYDEWVDINTQSGIVAGTAMTIMNKGGYKVYLYEASAQPDASLTDGELLTPYTYPYAKTDIEADRLTIWARCAAEGETCKLHVR